MIKKYIYGVSIILLLFSSRLVQSQSINIDVNLNVNHKVGDVTTLEREKFMTIHSDIDDKDWYENDNFTNDVINKFLNGYDVYMGRNTGAVQWIMDRVVRQDPNRLGYADTTHIASEGVKKKNTYANTPAWHAYESRNNKILCTQLHPFYPDGQVTKKGWAFSQTDTEAEPLGTASGEFYAHFIKHFFGEGGTTGQPAPTYIEVTNEPLWDLYNEIDHAFKFHRTVAKEVKKVNPNVKIGGYCTAFPNLEEDNFQRWENRWKKFMDTSGDLMDCWAIHLYDFPAIGGKKKLRRGSNVEATLDMMEQYSMMKFGKVKPFLITEYGASSHDYKGSWSPYLDYLHNTACNALVMQFMERSNNIGTAINYTMLKAKWGSPSADQIWDARLLRRANEPESLTGNWIYSDRVQFYQLWANVKGTRVDSYQNNLDIMTDAYVDGNKAYVVLNNLAWEDKQLTLNLFEDNDIDIQKLMVKHFRLDNANPVFDKNGAKYDTTYYNTASEIPSVFTVGSEGTMILEYTFANNISISETSTEVKYYAEEYYKPIIAGNERTFNINGVNIGTNGEAMLRVGVGRPHDTSLQPVIKINGTAIKIPNNFRGDAQEDRDTFFGVLEIPVPYNLLQANNTVSITFPDLGGHISSVTMQVFEFSKALKRTKTLVTGLSSNKLKSSSHINIYPNPADKYVTFDVSSSKEFTLNLYNSLGQNVFTDKIFKSKKVDISKLEGGVYYYSVSIDNTVSKGSLIITNKN